ncbi:DNA adenine modification methylase [Halomonas sp. I5-271120]|uniref:DNA adenine modification methylase n=1 Tax=Halomonas sp. I5-271120 TaxID=3061632 RepID=UPI00271530CF|nr:DNA adenine modification methylase [Halomonas sp. I5-271120]
MFSTSIVSYPDRGRYGKSSYRGNCSGHIVRDFVETYMPNGEGLFVDPSEGGGTSRDVARDLGVRYFGTDLSQGFNLLTDDLAEAAGEQAAAAWWHPPYWDMIAYSGKQWGGEAHPHDLSRLPLPEFVEALELAIMNLHDATRPGGTYGILMGNLRRQGRYYNLSSLVERVAPGMLVDEIIKVQHNCMSDTRQYSSRLVRIAHEKLLVFRRDQSTSLMFLETATVRANNMMTTTWRCVVRRVLQCGTTFDLQAIYARVEPYAQQRSNRNWKAKVRQVLQNPEHFDRVTKGVYRLAS